MQAHVMPETQRGVLGRVSPLASELGFYLAGGTAVAIRVGHRRSVDLDWFTGQSIDDPMDLARRMRDHGLEFAITDAGPGTLHGTADGVALSFLEYRYSLLEPPSYWAEYRCSVASIEDLACMKLSAIASRSAKRDFIDVYALGLECLRMERMLDLYRRKYDSDDIGHVLMSLTFFDDADPEEMPEMLWKADWQDVKRTIEQWVWKYTQDRSGRGGSYT